MNDPNQLEVPAAFLNLYVDPGQSKPNAPREFIWQRYEFCDDLATLLTEHAGRLRDEQRHSDADILERCYHGLLEDGSSVSPTEARWVIGRLAELLEWPLPPHVGAAPSDA